MNRKISVGMTVTIVILAMTVTFSITMLMAMRLFDHTVTSVKEKESMYNKVAEVDRYVRANDYYDIDETVLYDRLTAGYLLGTGDKYARYYTASAYTDLLNAQSGKLMGIGVELAIDQSGYAKVIKVYDESPAKEAGLQRGDYITTIDGADIKSLGSVEAVQNKLRGESGTSVNVGWLDSENAQHTADLTHSGFTANSVDSALVQGNVGYIKIWQFDNSTPSELDFALRSLTASGAQSFIFDLRDNGGGILDDAISCIELVAPEGVLAYAEDKAGNRTLLGRAAEGELFAETYAFLPDQPMLVSVVAAERGEALFLDPGKLMAPGCEPWRWQMMQNLLHILAGKNLNLARRSLYTAPKTIRERVTAYFSTLAVQKGSLEFELPFDRQQLADHLGVDRSALSSTLSAMQRDGLLTIDRRRVCLKKAEGL